MKKTVFVFVVCIIFISAGGIVFSQANLTGYFVNINEQITGPYDTAGLRQLVERGQLTRTSLVWKEGMTGWAAAGTIAELAPLISATPPPLPTPPALPNQTAAPQTGQVTQTNDVPAIPRLGEPTLLQQTLNRMPAIPIVGNNLQFVFGGDTWIAKRNGRDFLAGAFASEDTNEGVIITLAQTHTYPPRNIPGINWIRTPGPTIVLEYKIGPPASLTFVSRSQNDSTQQTAGGERGEDNAVKSANARDNWLSFELAFAGIGVRYERMLGSKISLGVNAYWNPFSDPMIAPEYYEINTFFRLYPWGKTFFLGIGLGYNEEIEGIYHIHHDYIFNGFTIIPELGWKIDVGKAGGFYLMPCITYPIVLSKNVGRPGYRMIYLGAGFAF
ncbi:MAG: DUF4339 domain-containing protein [Treponema sp.]|nr:DUF4339 domain-containing protein [Treponema sp.]